jgi:CheY-like chemotaxis protein
MLQHTVDRRITIQRKFTAENSLVVGDRSQIENMFLNLGINARDAMPLGGVLTYMSENVTIAPQNPVVPLAPGLYIKINVIDTGSGMDEETQEHIFEPFFTTKETGKGTGLGLASAYGTVKQHDGHITVKSEPGKGTTFSIYLPLEEKHSPVKEKQTEEEAVRGNGHILIIDDEETIRSAMEEALENLGYSTTLCVDGKAAVEEYKKDYHDIDAVVLDLIMPRMNGLDCFRALKKINPDIIVIVSSGYGNDTEKRAIMDEGAKRFLQKPFKLTELSKVLAELLNDDQAE